MTCQSELCALYGCQMPIDCINNRVVPNPGGKPPEHLRLSLERFARGCEVCGDMAWRATASGEMACRNCGNVFDVPLMDEANEQP